MLSALCISFNLIIKQEQKFIINAVQMIVQEKTLTISSLISLSHESGQRGLAGHTAWTEGRKQQTL